MNRRGGAVIKDGPQTDLPGRILLTFLHKERLQGCRRFHLPDLLHKGLRRR
jgi:hypothetical protein